jgi:plastocyanin
MSTSANSALALAFASVLVIAGSTSAEVHEVMQVSTSFVPADIEVEPGDTVRWIQAAGTHTVTSGTPCVHDETYFDEPLSSANPVVEWEVPDDLTGVLEYFCRPHCAAFDMVGTITVVVDLPCPGDVDDDGEVDFIDLLTLLGAWGPCAPPCPSDIDGSGEVDFVDLLELLASWGPCPGS